MQVQAFLTKKLKSKLSSFLTIEFLNHNCIVFLDLFSAKGSSLEILYKNKYFRERMNFKIFFFEREVRFKKSIVKTCRKC
jgi:hypothetical protein